MNAMEPPIGFIRLRDAVYAVGDKVFEPGWCASAWPRTGDLPAPIVFGPKTERVIRMVAERCEAAEIAAVYRSITGVDDLDRSVWRQPHWRRYFADGVIELDLPLVDGNLRPNNPNGHTARCAREIYLRRDDLDRLVATLSKPRSPAPKVSKAQIRNIITEYRRTLPVGTNPSMDAAVQFADDNGVTGHREEVREEYRQQFDHPRVGRRSK